MNLLRQTSLILGLFSLVIGGWALYRHWRSKITLLFSLFCFVTSIWALSFVSHETLVGRLSYDIHLFFNVWLVPIAITLFHQILFKKQDKLSQILQWGSFLGAVTLSSMIAFSLPRPAWVQGLMLFYPSLIVFEYFYGFAQDIVFRMPMNTDFISPPRKLVFYLGLAISLAFCTFDHIPKFGYTIPAIGNLLLTTYLVFASQVISPQKLLRLDALISRFFAIVILALIITGFFALLYPYISETFGLFLLNSFLISFAVLSLWNPLVTLFRYLGGRVFQSRQKKLEYQTASFKQTLSILTNRDEIIELTLQSIKLWTEGGEVKLIEEPRSVVVPQNVKAYFEYLKARKLPLVLHREILMMEQDQAMVETQRQEISWQIHFLDLHNADIIIPSFYQDSVILLTCIRLETPFEELSLNLFLYSVLFEVLQEVGIVLVRLNRVAVDREKDRLVLLGEMAAGLAHEVRNPLGAIRGAADLIPDSTSPWVNVIQEEVSRLNRLVSQFLDFAQDPKEQQETVDLNHIAKITIQDLMPTLPSHVHLSLNHLDASTVTVVPDHIRQVLINLIQNAVKATEEQPNPWIEVRVFGHEIRVKDNGVGMTKEVKEKVFQPFFTSFKKGTGLGLSICQRLTSFNGGTISIQSDQGLGTEVTVTFSPKENHA